MTVHPAVSLVDGRRGRRAIGLLAGVALIFSAHSAAAADVTIGLGAALAPDYEGSEDYQAAPSWLLAVNNLYHPATNVTLRGPQLRSNFVAHPQLRAGVSGLWVPERDDVDNSRVDRLDSTDTALMLGGIVGWDFFPQPELSLTAAVDFTYDVANNNGYLVTPHVGYANALPGSPLSVGAELFATWASEDYMDEQFSISAGNAARSGLDQYSADDSFKDVGLKGNVTYAFNESWSTTFAAQYKLLVEDAADSPIVDDEGSEHQFVAGVTVNFKF